MYIDENDNVFLVNGYKLYVVLVYEDYVFFLGVWFLLMIRSWF